LAKNIEPRLKLISEYLKLEKPENFVIPEYQRGYSWNVIHCDKLWQDIDAFIESIESGGMIHTFLALLSWIARLKINSV